MTVWIKRVFDWTAVEVLAWRMLTSHKKIDVDGYGIILSVSTRNIFAGLSVYLK